MKQEIKIAVATKDTLSIDLLTPLQGDLKTLSDVNYKKLRDEILEDGFSFALHVWEDVTSANIYILDGHQRYQTLQKMRREKYSIPEIPVVFVEADDIDHAKRKVLAGTSQYGEFNQEGAEKFFKTFNSFDPNMFNKTLHIPQIDLSKFEFKPITTEEVKFTKKTGGGSKEISEDELGEFDHVCPKCSFHFNDPE